MADGRKRAVEEAADTIREGILTRHYPPGDHLPGERDLAIQLGVSRLTLRSAIARLEAEGLVRAVHGSGNLVQDYRESGGVDLLGYLASLAFEGRVVPVNVLGELLELRRAIAVEAVGMAAERATEAELAQMRAHLKVQETLVEQPRAYMEADLGFARLVVRATHNIAFELIFNTVCKVIAGNGALELAYYANARQTMQVYDRVLTLIEGREAHRIRLICARLLDRLDRRTLYLLSGLSAEPEAAEEELDEA